MLIDRACQITKIRMSELNRVSLTALEAVIRQEKATPESHYSHNQYTKAEYIEAYETIKNYIQRGEH